jgi:hypothetical protein
MKVSSTGESRVVAGEGRRQRLSLRVSLWDQSQNKYHSVIFGTWRSSRECVCVCVCVCVHETYFHTQDRFLFLCLKVSFVPVQFAKNKVHPF